VPALFVASFGVSTSRAAFMLMPIVFALVLGAPLFGRLLDRVGSRVVVLCATTLIARAWLLVAAFPAPLALVYGGGFTVGLGMAGLMGSSLRYVMLNEAPIGERGAAQGVLTVFISTGRLVGAAAVGAVIGASPTSAASPPPTSSWRHPHAVLGPLPRPPLTRRRTARLRAQMSG
jgi:MFS family permease